MNRWGIGGFIFVGCMFIGGGLGILLGNSHVGWLIGMGVGFIGMGLTKIMNK